MRPTPRQLEILCLYSQGKSWRQIGLELFVSPHTVRRHVQDLMAVLHTRTIAQAIVVAVARGYLAVDETSESVQVVVLVAADSLSTASSALVAA